MTSTRASWRSAPRRSSSSAAGAGRCGTPTRAVWSRCASRWPWACGRPETGQARDGAHASRARPRGRAALAGARRHGTPPRYAAGLPGRAGGAIEVTLVTGADDRLAFRAARELDRRPALAALVAPAEPGDAAAPAAVAQVCAMLRNRRQEAVVSGPLPASTTGSTGAATSDALEAAVADGRLPVSWLPAAAAAPRRAPRGRRALVAAARANVADARPRLLAGHAGAGPQLDAPRLRLRRRAAHRRRRRWARRTPRSRGVLASLRLWGFPAGASRWRRRLAAAADRSARSSTGRAAQARRWRLPGTSGCRQEVSSGQTTARARRGLDSGTDTGRRRRRPTRRVERLLRESCRGPAQA